MQVRFYGEDVLVADFTQRGAVAAFLAGAADGEFTCPAIAH